MSFVDLIQQPRKETSSCENRPLAAAKRRSAANKRPIKIPGVTGLALGCALLLALVAVQATTQAATITVTGTGDTIAVDGLVTLREAITSANNNANVNADVVAVGVYGTDMISFNVAGPGVHTIAPTADLPVITDPVIIDGYTQPGASVNTLAVGDNAVLLIELDGTAAPGGCLGIGVGGNTIRGLVINRFIAPDAGVAIFVGSDANLIEGNFIGTDPTGTSVLSNGAAIAILIGSNNIIGGTSPQARNLISGNASAAFIFGSDNVIQGNLIGTQKDGVSPLGNGFGVTIQGNNNLVGGTVPGAGNVIAFSPSFSGIILESDSGTGNSFLGNSIFSNRGLGIDLDAQGVVTPNDLGDADTGANNLQNYPVISGLTVASGNVTITGTFNSEASKTYRLEFFASPTADPSGYGEGQTFLGFKDVTTNGSGDAAFSVIFPVAGTSAAFTATATDPDGNTSEFSAAFATKLLNISTRMRVLTDDNVLIGGFIVTGISPKKVIVRAIGPSLGNQGVQGALADPTLELNLPDGSMITNDNWKDTQQAEIEATTIPPTDDHESAMVQSLVPGAYTATVRGKNGTTGVGLVEAYDLDQPADSRLANISTRGFIDTGDNVMIGGFIIGPADLGAATVLIRGIGPSLANAGVADPLQDPTLELHDGNGALLISNDDWKDTQQSEIEATTIPPTDDRESAILQTLAPGNYTAIVRGAAGTTGVGLVEVYHLQ